MLLRQDDLGRDVGHIGVFEPSSQQVLPDGTFRLPGRQNLVTHPVQVCTATAAALRRFRNLLWRSLS